MVRRRPESWQEHDGTRSWPLKMLLIVGDATATSAGRKEEFGSWELLATSGGAALLGTDEPCPRAL